LYLLQRVRDEAHRTAIRYQRQKRSTRMTTSVLDDIPGLGPARRKALLSRFGSVRKLRAASPEMISEVPGIGPALAGRIIQALSGERIEAVNLTTGEILGDDVPVSEESVGAVPVTEEPR
jgi:excinuclease ABC subunit C